ncbi:MAG: hypothetical protein KC423_29450, partial [Anaerolineales bacterium]|nr:hypothetical protein [Anaerolineales bacterium]
MKIHLMVVKRPNPSWEPTAVLTRPKYLFCTAQVLSKSLMGANGRSDQLLMGMLFPLLLSPNP